MGNGHFDVRAVDANSLQWLALGQSKLIDLRLNGQLIMRFRGDDDATGLI